MRSSQFRKTANRNRKRIRNKKKTWRNKRTKNARGGKLITSHTENGKYEWVHDDVSNDIFNMYQWINGNKLPTFEGTMNQKGDGHGKLYTYTPDGNMISMYEGFITGKKKHGHGKYQRYDSNGILVSVYDGGWKDDKKNGQGVYHRIGKNTYSGQWDNDEKHGNGVESGPLWEGAKKIGTIQTENGVWKNGTVVSGKRTINYNDATKSVYEGGLNGVMVRQGTGTYQLYDADNKMLQDIYAVWDKNEVKTSLPRHQVQSELTPQPSVLLQSTPTQKTHLSLPKIPPLPPPPKSKFTIRPPLPEDNPEDK